MAFFKFACCFDAGVSLASQDLRLQYPDTVSKASPGNPESLVKHAQEYPPGPFLKSSEPKESNLKTLSTKYCVVEALKASDSPGCLQGQRTSTINATNGERVCGSAEGASERLTPLPRPAEGAGPPRLSRVLTMESISSSTSLTQLPSTSGESTSISLGHPTTTLVAGPRGDSSAHGSGIQPTDARMGGRAEGNFTPRTFSISSKAQTHGSDGEVLKIPCSNGEEVGGEGRRDSGPRLKKHMSSKTIRRGSSREYLNDIEILGSVVSSSVAEGRPDNNSAGAVASTAGDQDMWACASLCLPNAVVWDTEQEVSRGSQRVSSRDLLPSTASASHPESLGRNGTRFGDGMQDVKADGRSETSDEKATPFSGFVLAQATDKAEPTASDTKPGSRDTSTQGEFLVIRSSNDPVVTQDSSQQLRHSLGSPPLAPCTPSPHPISLNSCSVSSDVSAAESSVQTPNASLKDRATKNPGAPTRSVVPENETPVDIAAAYGSQPVPNNVLISLVNNAEVNIASEGETGPTRASFRGMKRLSSTRRQLSPGTDGDHQDSLPPSDSDDAAGAASEQPIKSRFRGDEALSFSCSDFISPSNGSHLPDGSGVSGQDSCSGVVGFDLDATVNLSSLLDTQSATGASLYSKRLAGLGVLSSLEDIALAWSRKRRMPLSRLTVSDNGMKFFARGIEHTTPREAAGSHGDGAGHVGLVGQLGWDHLSKSGPKNKSKSSRRSAPDGVVGVVTGAILDSPQVTSDSSSARQISVPNPSNEVEDLGATESGDEEEEGEESSGEEDADADPPSDAALSIEEKKETTEEVPRARGLSRGMSSKSHSRRYPAGDDPVVDVSAAVPSLETLSDVAYETASWSPPIDVKPEDSPIASGTIPVEPSAPGDDGGRRLSAEAASSSSSYAQVAALSSNFRGSPFAGAQAFASGNDVSTRNGQKVHLSKRSSARKTSLVLWRETLKEVKAPKRSILKHPGESPFPAALKSAYTYGGEDIDSRGDCFVGRGVPRSTSESGINTHGIVKSTSADLDFGKPQLQGVRRTELRMSEGGSRRGSRNSQLPTAQGSLLGLSVFSRIVSRDLPSLPSVLGRSQDDGSQKSVFASMASDRDAKGLLDLDSESSGSVARIPSEASNRDPFRPGQVTLKKRSNSLMNLITSTLMAVTPKALITGGAAPSARVPPSDGVDPKEAANGGGGSDRFAHLAPGISPATSSASLDLNGLPATSTSLVNFTLQTTGSHPGQLWRSQGEATPSSVAAPQQPTGSGGTSWTTGLLSLTGLLSQSTPPAEDVGSPLSSGIYIRDATQGSVDHPGNSGVSYHTSPKDDAESSSAGVAASGGAASSSAGNTVDGASDRSGASAGPLHALSELITGVFTNASRRLSATGALHFGSFGSFSRGKKVSPMPSVVPPDSVGDVGEVGVIPQVPVAPSVAGVLRGYEDASSTGPLSPFSTFDDRDSPEPSRGDSSNLMNDNSDNDFRPVAAHGIPREAAAARRASTRNPSSRVSFLPEPRVVTLGRSGLVKHTTSLDLTKLDVLATASSADAPDTVESLGLEDFRGQEELSTSTRAVDESSARGSAPLASSLPPPALFGLSPAAALMARNFFGAPATAARASSDGNPSSFALPSAEDEDVSANGRTVVFGLDSSRRRRVNDNDTLVLPSPIGDSSAA